VITCTTVTAWNSYVTLFSNESTVYHYQYSFSEMLWKYSTHKNQAAEDLVALSANANLFPGIQEQISLK